MTEQNEKIAGLVLLGGMAALTLVATILAFMQKVWVVFGVLVINCIFSSLFFVSFIAGCLMESKDEG